MLVPGGESEVSEPLGEQNTIQKNKNKTKTKQKHLSQVDLQAIV